MKFENLSICHRPCFEVVRVFRFFHQKNQLVLKYLSDFSECKFFSRESGNYINLLRSSYIMATGTVKWFNSTKGYGFIHPESGGTDVFVHSSALEAAGIKSLNEGQRVSYEVVSKNGKTSAAELKIL